MAVLVGPSRTRQALLSVAQPGLGAVLAVGGLPSLRVSLVGLIAAAAGFLAVFSLSDVLDRRADAAALRDGKGEVAAFDRGAVSDGDSAFARHLPARGDLRLRFSLVWVVSLAALCAALAYTLAPVCLLLFAAAVALEVVYCALRAVTPWKTVVSGVMVGLAGVAGWAAAAPLSWRALSVFVFLALWQIGGRDIAGDLADVASDRRVGATTVATVYGPAVAARAACIIGFATLAAVVILPMSGGLLSDLALVAGVFIVAWPGAKLWYSPTSDEAAAYLEWVSLYPAAVLLVALLPALFGAL
jgi:4-hydroxybenzoate polyprenyltransferase